MRFIICEHIKSIFFINFCAFITFLILSINFTQGNNFSVKEDLSDAEKYYMTAQKYFSNTEEYDSAIVNYTHAASLFLKFEDWKGVITCNLKLTECFNIKGEFQLALDNANRAMQIAELHLSQDELIFSDIYYLLSKIEYELGNYNESISHLKKGLQYIDHGKTEYDSIKVLIFKTLGNNYFMLGKNNSALKSYNDALNIEVDRNGDSTSSVAALYANIGIIYSAKGYYFEAEKYIRNSLRIKEQFLSVTDPKLARGYVNLGRLLAIIGNTEGALEFYIKAEKIYIEKFGPDYYKLALVYFNEGGIFILKNDFQKALTYHEKALELYSKYLKPSNAVFGKLYSNFGLIYKDLGDYNKAIEFYTQGIDKTSNTESEIIGLRNLASCYQAIKDYDKAGFYYRLSIEKAIELLGNNHTQLADCYLYFGEFYNEINDFDKAKELFSKAYFIYKNNFGEKNRDVSNVLSKIGDLLLTLQDYKNALYHYQLSLLSIVNNFNDSIIYNNPVLSQLTQDVNTIECLDKKAKTFYFLYFKKTNNINDLIACLESGELAIQLFEIIRVSYTGESIKLLATQKINNLHKILILASIELYKRTGDPQYLRSAFEYSEKNKAAVLLSSIKELEAMDFSNVPVDIMNFERLLKSDIANYRNLIFEEELKKEPDEDKLIKWKNDYFEITKKYDSLISNIENNYPEYYQLKYDNSVMDINKIQASLSDEDVFIEYALVDSVLVIFCISSDTLICKLVNQKNNFKENVLSYIEITHNLPEIENSKEGFINFTNLAYELFQFLLEPISDCISGKKLLIIPDDILGYISFESLINRMPDTNKVNYKNLSYIIKNHSVSYSYSATLLFKELKKRKNTGKLLAMAPLYDNINDTYNIGYISRMEYEQLITPLDYNIEEVEQVRDIMGGKSFTGKEASEKYFKLNAQKYNILHLAMHAFINNDEPLASKLVFAFDNDSIEDGFLNTYEIYNLDLNAQLAVLSACKTGAGKLSKGEGIMSLARGFFYAGVPGIVMTLWEIEDVSSAEIMTGFYKSLKRGLTKDEALRIAKLSYLESANQLNAHPYFWAAYVQIGNNSPIATNFFIKHYYLFIIIFLACLGSIYLVKVISARRNRNN